MVRLLSVQEISTADDGVFVLPGERRKNLEPNHLHTHQKYHLTHLLIAMS